jgi:hypothetical protein
MTAFNRIVPAVALSLASIAAGAQDLGACRALIENRNDFWLVQANGSVISRITSDGFLKPAAALQPGGQLVAYSTQDPSRELVLSDATGRVLDQAGINAGEPVVELKWTTAGALRAAVHQSPSHSQHHFFTLMPGNRLSRTMTEGAAGADCATSPAGRQIACVVGDAVTLDGKEIYFAAGPFESRAIVQTATVGLGSSVSIAATPVLRVEFKEQTANSVTLRVTTPDNQWQQQRVPTGRSMPVMTGEGTGAIGIEPVRTTDPSTIKLVVMKSDTGYARFAGNLAWDPSGQRMAVVESNDAGQSTLVLLARQMGQAAIDGQGAIDARIRLPVEAPIHGVHFPTSTTIRVEGAREVVEYDIPAHGKVRSPRYSVKPRPLLPTSLPVTLGGAPVVATVRDWSCPER